MVLLLREGLCIPARLGNHLWLTRSPPSISKRGEHYFDAVEGTYNTELAEFSVQDEEGKWHWAKAVIDGDTALVRNDEFAQPQNVRYAHDWNPCVNLYNKEGYPPHRSRRSIELGTFSPAWKSSIVRKHPIPSRKNLGFKTSRTQSEIAKFLTQNT